MTIPLLSLRIRMHRLCCLLGGTSLRFGYGEWALWELAQQRSAGVSLHVNSVMTLHTRA
jgi:hypothetical protein